MSTKYLNVLRLYIFACCKEGMTLVGQSIVMLIPCGGIVCHSCKWLLARIRAGFFTVVW